MSSCKTKALYLLCLVTFPSIALSFLTSTLSSPASLNLASSQKVSKGSKYKGRSLALNWGADIEWGTTKLVDSSVAATGDLYHVLIESYQGKHYSTPGQYMQMKDPSLGDEAKAGFFAIASPPAIDFDDEKKEMEFLIRKNEGTAWLCDPNRVGTDITISPPMGNGFPLEMMVNDESMDTLVLLCVGSGISPIRSVIESDMFKKATSLKHTRLYYGVKDESHLAYKDLFTKWTSEKSGLEIIPVFSQGNQETKIYIQDQLSEDYKNGKFGQTSGEQIGALMCGMKGMVEGCKEVMATMGVDESKIRMNF